MELFCILVVMVMVIQICGYVKIHRLYTQKSILLYYNLKNMANFQKSSMLDAKT